MLCEENFKHWSPAHVPLAIPKLNLLMCLNVSSKQFSCNLYKLVYLYVQNGRYGKHRGIVPVSVARKRLNPKLVDLRAVIAKNNSYPLLSAFFMLSIVFCRL